MSKAGAFFRRAQAQVQPQQPPPPAPHAASQPSSPPPAGGASPTYSSNSYSHSLSPTTPTATTAARPSALPRLQASIASTMRGYTAPLATAAGRFTPAPNSATSASPVTPHAPPLPDSHSHSHSYSQPYSQHRVNPSRDAPPPAGYTSSPPASSGLPHPAQSRAPAAADFDSMVAQVGLNGYGRYTASPPDMNSNSNSYSNSNSNSNSHNLFDHRLDLGRNRGYDSSGNATAKQSRDRFFAEDTDPENDDGAHITSPGGFSGSDHFSPLPNFVARRAGSPGRHHDHRIGAKALASPPPHERYAVNTESSHESGFSGMTGLTDASAPPHLSRSTSTVVTSLTTVTSPLMSSDEMLMALMASQAAVDCNTLPIGAWEEVETWKKELSLLSTRLDALQARHQREVKILTAARTLQKLNQSNKRISKQTLESLEQSEKRVEKAEKEVLVLRSREAALRRRLMEHWAGIMAWEVRRLERNASDAQSRLEMQVRAADSDRQSLIERLASMDTGEPMPSKMLDGGDPARELYARLAELENALQAERSSKAVLESEKEESSSRLAAMESEREHSTSRVAELEEMVLELGRRERALEDGARGHDQKLMLLEKEKADWQREREAHARERETYTTERSLWDAERAQAGELSAEREAWAAEKAQLIAERDKLRTERTTFESAVRERDAKGTAWAADRERLSAERDQLAAERAQLMAERDKLAGERDQMQKAREELETRHAEERDIWAHERTKFAGEREQLQSAASSGAVLQRERDAAQSKYDRMAADLDALALEHDRLKEQSRSLESVHDKIVAEKEQVLAKLRDDNAQLKVAADRANAMSRATTERIGASVSAILGRTVADADLIASLDEVHAMINARDVELKALRDQQEHEMSSSQGQMTELMRKIQNQTQQIQQLQTSAGQTSGVDAKLRSLWTALPSPKARAEAGLTDPQIVSPNRALNFAVLQKAYSGSSEKYTNVDDLNDRVRALIDDSRVMLERLQRLEVEKDRHKANAQRAAQLVHDSRSSLEKYKEQVAQLEERSNSSEQLEQEIQVLHLSLTQAHHDNERLQKETEDAQTMINTFSQRTLTMADEHEREKSALQLRLQREVENLRAELALAAQGLDEERSRAQLQSAQMMGEMMDLQDEIAKLRARR